MNRIRWHGHNEGPRQFAVRREARNQPSMLPRLSSLRAFRPYTNSKRDDRKIIGGFDGIGSANVTGGQGFQRLAVSRGTGLCNGLSTVKAPSQKLQTQRFVVSLYAGICSTKPAFTKLRLWLEPDSFQGILSNQRRHRICLSVATNRPRIRANGKEGIEEEIRTGMTDVVQCVSRGDGCKCQANQPADETNP